MSPSSRALIWRIAALVLVVAAIIWIGRCEPVTNALLEVERTVSQTKWGALIYPLLFAACNVLLLPGGILAIGAGFFFGLWWGFTVTFVGNLLGAIAAFWLSRKIGRRWIERKMSEHRQLVALDHAIERQGWRIIFWSQLHPLFPTSLLTYIYGVTRVTFGQCMLWVSLARTPGLFLYAYLGTLAQFGVRVLRGETQPARVEFAIWAGGLAVTVLVTIALAVIAYRIIREVVRAPADLPERDAAFE